METDKIHERVIEIQNNIQTASSEQQTEMLSELLSMVSKIEQSLSDIKLKQDIVDASSQWNDIKALRVRKYRFKDKPNDSLQIGLIAQEVEHISAGLVQESPDEIRDEDGNITFTGETTKAIKYSVLYMKAVKALQEAMERIEQSEIAIQEQQAIIESLTARIETLEKN